MELGWWVGDRPAEGAEQIMWALARSPDPGLALRGAERLVAALTDRADRRAFDAALRAERGLRGRLFALLGELDRARRPPGRAPRPLAPALRRRRGPAVGSPATDPGPALLAAVGAEPDAPPAGSPGGAAASLTGSAAIQALRTAYRDELLVLAAADLAAAAEPELPVLTWRTSRGGCRTSRARPCGRRWPSPSPSPPMIDRDPGRLAVIAMGKCGGQELNYVSDVDVIFVARPRPTPPPPGSRDGDADPGRVAASTVDANLRPEGSQGALVRTLDGHVAYYKRWARTWEFQALLKARPVAGDPELGKAYAEAVAPMVWSAAETAGLRRRRAGHAPARRGERAAPTSANREIKLGPGGLRDVEFAVQLLQLVHGRTDEALRSGSTLDALRALSDGGYVGRDDGANLAASYRFLRLLEHRLQLQRLRRTHLLPAANDTDALRWLARAARLRPDGRNDVVGVLMGEWTRNARRVRRLHAKLFYRPLLTAVSRLSADAARLSEKEAAARLGALGWTSPEGALGHLRALTGGVSRAAAIQQTLLPVLLDELARQPRSRPRPARLPAGVRRAGRHAVVPAAAARRGAGRAAAHAAAGHVGASAGPARARAGGAAPARRADGGPRRRAAARPGGRRRRRCCARWRASPSPECRRGDGPLAASARAAARRVRGPARRAVDARRCAPRCRSVWVAVLRGHAGVGAAGAGRSARQAARAVRHDRHGPARRGRAELRQRRRRALRLRAAAPARSEQDAVRVRAPGRRGPSGAASAPSPGPAAGRRRRPAPRGPQRAAGAQLASYARLLRALVAGLGGAGAAAGAGRWRATPTWARASSRWSTRCATRPRVSTRRHVTEIRRIKARVDTRAAAPGRRPGHCTRSSAAAASPTSSGRCSCCSCSTGPTSRSCAPPRRSTACAAAARPAC